MKISILMVILSFIRNYNGLGGLPGENLFMCEPTNCLKESFESKIKDLEKKISDKVEDIRKNPVPIGFIYIKLPNQEKPWILWPKTQWRDISSDYAGVFFRVLGDGSAGFEETQSENSPRITAVSYDAGGNDDIYIYTHTGEWSNYIKTGGNINDGDGLNFYVSDGEVRPRNMAMLIWKRIP